MSQRRAQLLEAAARLFHQYGPQKTTVGDIAQAAGIGVGSVYLEFPNKDAILLALSEAGHQSVLDAIGKALARRGAAEHRLRWALDARLEAFLTLARHGMHGADLLHCGSCAPIQRAHQAFCLAERQLFTDFVAEAARQRAFRADSPPDTARALLVAYTAFSPPVVFRYPKADLRRDIIAVHELVLSGLLVR